MNFIPRIDYIELNTGLSKSVNFETPPEGDPFDESLRTIRKKKRSTAGVQQVQFNYHLKSYNLEFIFQSETVFTEFKDFVENHASRGGSFDYYSSNDEVDFETFEMVTESHRFSRPIPAATLGEFEYDFSFRIERAFQ